jgi:FtsP/CotA-like multicopper oxidase with cupredoxin domain
MMYTDHVISRRSFLRQVIGGSAVLFGVLPAARRLFSFDESAVIGPETAGKSDIELLLRAGVEKVHILPGRPTTVLRYHGELIRGPDDAIQELPGSYLGPVIRVEKGQRIGVRFENHINEDSIVHWHGLHVPSDMDGHPRYAIGPGGIYSYDITVHNRAGTYWFHPHPHGRTGPQVYFGLAGLFIVSDPEERSAGLPAGDYDIPLVIQDRTFDSENQLHYLERGMMDRMVGYLGDRILVNGRIDHIHPVASRSYRLRILNGSNARIYKIAWEDGTPLTVIGTDGGLLEGPITRPYVMLGPGERIELWADFSRYPLSSEIRLVSLPFAYDFEGGMMGRGGSGMGMMHGNMMGGEYRLPQGSFYSLVGFRIDRTTREKSALPDMLGTRHSLDEREAVNRRNPRRFTFTMQGMHPTINGRIFEMNSVAEDEVVKLDTTEVWEFLNGGGGMMGMMQMPHPVHVHGVQFQILERSVERSYADQWRDIRDGFVDEGLKDTTLLMPGMRVRILLRFEEYAGLFLYHCHNLEHEDMGMMRNYLIRS